MVVVARVVDARDDPVAEVLLLGDLADEHVVLVVAGDRDHEVGALDPGALEHPQLGGVAVLRGVLELLLDRQVAAREDSISVTSWPLMISSRARFRPTLPAPTMITYMATTPAPAASARSNISIACLVGEIVCRPCSPYQSARAGSITRTITFCTPNRFWAIWAMMRLVLSPAVEAMKTSARSIPAWISASVSSAVPTVNWPSRVLPALALPGVQALVRERVLVEHRDFVACRERRLGDRRADAAGADDQDEHEPD